MESTLVKIVYGPKKNPLFKTIPFTYKISSGATIAEVKNEIRQHFNRPYLECKAAHQSYEHLESHLLDDTQLFVNENDITFNAADEIDKMQHNSTCILKNGTECLEFKHKRSLTLWKKMNENSIEKAFDLISALFHSDHTKLQLFLVSANLKWAAVMIKFKDICSSQCFYEQALESIYTSMLYSIKTNCSKHTYYFETHALLISLSNIFDSSIFTEWANYGHDTTLMKNLDLFFLGKAFEEPCPEETVQVAQNVKYEEIEVLANEVKKAQLIVDVKQILKDSVLIRQSWYTYLKSPHCSGNGKTLTQTVINKFPVLQKDISLLKYDYSSFMEKSYKKNPKFGDTFAHYSTAIIKLGALYNIPYYEEKDVTLSAARMLPQILNKYFKTKSCKFERLVLTITNSININELLLQKEHITSQPILGLTTYKNKKAYYVLVDGFALQVHTDVFSTALHSLFEVKWVFHLGYEETNALFYEFLELIAGFSQAKYSKAAFLKQKLDEIISNQEEYQLPHAETVESKSQQNDEQNTRSIIDELQSIINVAHRSRKKRTHSESTEGTLGESMKQQENVKMSSQTLINNRNVATSLPLLTKSQLKKNMDLNKQSHPKTPAKRGRPSKVTQ